ncbi:MAG: hypothetical protein LBQ59_00465 [Candidatus Peribacteria bacterium]|jgi:hypothetical protein|nr:hypothetical protein [Candidatus Peribacteria bacterium]
MKDTLVAGLNKIITEYNPTDKNYEIIKILTEKIDEIEITTNTSSQENNLQQEDIR